MPERINPHDAPDTSASQDSWQEISEAIRNHLHARAAYMPGMDIAELQAYLECVKEGLWLEQNASSFDVDLERMKARRSWRD